MDVDFNTIFKQLMDQVNKCFAQLGPQTEQEASSIPAAKSAQVAQPKAETASSKAPVAAVAPAAGPSQTVSLAAAAAAATTPDHHAPKKPEGALDQHPEYGTLVTDGKCYFYDAAFKLDGVYKTRDEEVALLNKAITIKKEAGAATGQANKLHESGDIEASKPYRAEAKAKHAESLDLEIKVALSMAKKAQYAPEPEIDYHVFLLQGFTDSWDQVLEIVRANKLGAKKFLVIPGAGEHSQKDVGPKIKPELLKWFAEKNVKYTEETHGSYLMDL